uniref:Non-specific protein-tyrosine kinase n=1 Tax=Panagrellus redivivus TaxID=6233 RepID=A0A7E4VGP3_PANRE
MIVNGLHLIFVLLNVWIVITADDISKTLHKFRNDTIRGIDIVHKTGAVGVVLDKKVYVGQLQDIDDLIDIAEISLDELVHADPSGDSSLLEFKLINESSAFICTSDGCSFCSQATEEKSNCFAIPISPKPGKWSSVSATFVNDDVVLRTVHDKGNASIYYFYPSHRAKTYELPKITSNDASGISEIETVAAFSTREYSYFVGSAKRMDLPLFLSKPMNPIRNINDVRLTRVCNDDATDYFASRIDLVLGCNGISYNNSTKRTMTNRATAALYLPELKRLLVASQHNNNELGITENYICSYNLTDLKFSETWNKCQNLLTPLNSKDCQGQYANLKDECYLFSWDNPNKHKQCSAYDGKTGNDKLENCEVSSGSLKPYGSLENFKPYFGKTLFSETHTEPIVAIHEITNTGALYALREDNHVIQLLSGDEKTVNVVSSIATIPGKYMFDVFPKNNEVLLVTQCDNECNMTITDGTVPAMCTTKNSQKDTCLIKVKDSFKSSTKKEIPSKLPENTSVKTTSKPHEESTFVTRAPKNPNSEITANSEVNTTAVTPQAHNNPGYETTANPANKNRQSSETTTILPGETVKSSSYIWKVIFYFLSAIGVCVAILCIYICMTRRQSTQIISRAYANDYQRVIPLKIMSDQLNPNNLIVLNTQPLGSGVSATVYKGSYKTNAGDYEQVAVKVFNDEYAALLDTEELVDELKVLRRIQHSNIVSFIGHTYIDRTLHIVTEYMAGGSLYDYIQNENTVLKYQHTFDHMDQILSAMVYLTQQEIVHRDLAARNCLLNKDYTVIKVSDFGLARSVDFKGEYQILHIDTALPTRWIALEAFSQHKFTEKSDVWSFGVLVWELFTRGNTPYFPLDHNQIIMFLNEGRRLQCPVTCPDQIYALIITCWDNDPKKRPTFKQLQKDMKDVVHQLTSANKHLTETEYERPCQPLTHFGSRAVTAV